MFNSKLKARIKELEASNFTLEAAFQQQVGRVKLYEEQEEDLRKRVAALSRQKDPVHSVGAIDYIVYDNKVLSKIGNAMLSATDNPAFKLGIQFALRHFEKELVIGR